MISLILACDKNMVIGNSETNSMPWGRSIPKDLEFFREQTIGHVVAYGRKTFESMGSKPLAFRTNLILTHHHFNIHADLPTNAFTISSVKEVLNYNKNHLHSDRKLFVCGGAEIYKQFLPYADEMILTHIDHSFEGDIYFPLSKSELDSEYDSEMIKEISISNSNPYHLTMKKYTKK